MTKICHHELSESALLRAATAMADGCDRLNLDDSSLEGCLNDVLPERSIDSLLTPLVTLRSVPLLKRDVRLAYL